MILLDSKVDIQSGRVLQYVTALAGFRLLLAFSPHIAADISEYREGLEIHRNLNGDQRRELDFFKQSLPEERLTNLIALKDSDLRDRPNGSLK